MSDLTISAQIATLRRFNREVTPRIGVLDDTFLGRGRPLAHSRMLFEIGTGAPVRHLRDRLGLDSGYVSRVLRALSDEGLIEVHAAPDDGRVRVARPTAAGLEEVEALHAASDAAARGILERLPAGARERLAAASATVTALMQAATTEIVAVRGHDPSARWCMERYFEEFDATVPGGLIRTGMVTSEPGEVDPPNGLTVLVRSMGEPLGCGMLKRTAPGVVDVKRVWLEPSVRGAGLATALMDRLEAEAVAMGCHTARLETNEHLTAAIEMYRRRGYVEVEPFNAEPNAQLWFALDLRTAT